VGARFLGDDFEITNPASRRVYTTATAEAWKTQDAALNPPGYIVGAGGFGVTYRVVDDDGHAFALKEYFPKEYADRDDEGVIRPKASEDGFNAAIFEEGLRRFIAEGQMLAAFDHPNIIRPLDDFEADGTGYQVFPLVEGRETLAAGKTPRARSHIARRVTLEDYLKEIEAGGERLSLSLFKPLLEQILSAVDYVHREGAAKAAAVTGETARVILHRDIKPSNILILAPDALKSAPAAEVFAHPDTKALLADFGSARVQRDNDDRSVSTPVTSRHYSPPELNDNRVEAQGPHSDIYSLGALIWRALVGKAPETTDLLSGAKLASRMPAGNPPPAAFAEAVDWSLKQAPQDRPQSVTQWRERLFSTTPGATNGPGGGKPPPDPLPPKKLSPLVVWGGGGAAVLALIVLVVVAGAGSVEHNIIQQARAAYDDSNTRANQADQDARQAEQDAEGARGLVDQSVEVAKEGVANYGAGTTASVHHDYYSTTVLPGEQMLNWTEGPPRHCYTPSANITPDNWSDVPSHTYPYNGASVVCGISHTYRGIAAYSGARSPWGIDHGNWKFAGAVTDDQQTPNGSGVMALGETRFVGQITPKDGAFSWTGDVQAPQGRKMEGKGALTPEDPKLAVPDWSGVESFSDQQAFRGHAQRGGRSGVFTLTNGWQVTGSRDQNQQWIVGRILLPSGVTWYGSLHAPARIGSPPAADNQQARTWARIETGGRIYWGQVSNGKPDGCGVWVEPGGGKRAGTFADGERVRGPDKECGAIKREALTDDSVEDDANTAGK
jgi:serine/threonine protein kinase